MISAPGVLAADCQVEVASGGWIPGMGGYYADDLLAIRAGAAADGHFYVGTPRLPGHPRIRTASLAVQVTLSDSTFARGWGDVVASQYSGFAQRHLPISRETVGPQVDMAVAALCEAGPVTFTEGCEVIEAIRFEERPLHPGVRYGVSQALLGLVSQRSTTSGAAILAAVCGRRALGPIPIYAQSGEHRYRGVDKMILKHVDVLPHGLINSTAIFGNDGRVFLDYAGWVRSRVLHMGDPGYRPRLHFDVYGLPGLVFAGSQDRMLEFCRLLVDACAPLEVQLESPVYGASVSETIEALATLRGELRARAIAMSIVADDWCNTLEDVRAFASAGAANMIQLKMPDLGALTNALEGARLCRSLGAGVFVGGSCTETDSSARYSVQVAVAVAADQVLAKPGMGVDEGFSIVFNEMQRALLESRPASLVRVHGTSEPELGQA